jgi:hypothetical protein
MYAESLKLSSSDSLDRVEITGLEAFDLALSELQPVDSSQEIWLKYGHESFVVMDTFDPTGPCWETKGNGTERVRTIQHPNRYDFLVNKEKKHGGGVFLLHSQPQDYPLKECVSVSDNICVELDDGTPEEQWDKLSEFVHLSGLESQKILTSGGKSYHAHWQGTEHFPIEETVYLRRLMAIALRSDPAACNPHQPMRVEGFDRHENGTLKGHQTRVYQSDNRYTYAEMLAGLKRYFAAKGIPFPDAITDEWWSILKRPLKANDLDELKAELSKGLAGYEAEKKAKAKKAEKKRQERLKQWGNQPVTNGLGKTVSECVEQAKHRLGTSLYEKYGYEEGDRRFGCPFHASQSKNSAWVNPATDGTPLFHCSTCTNEKGINSFQFFLMESNGSFEIPSGKEYVESARDYVGLVGLELPNLKPQKSSNQGNKNGGRLLENEWSGLAEENYQLGRMIPKGQSALPEFEPKTDFIFFVERILQSETTGGGYVLRIERVVDGKLVTSRVTIDGNAFSSIKDFKEALNSGLGIHLVCNISVEDLNKTLKVRINEFYKKGGKISRLATRHGCQSDGIWVFKNAQFTPEGVLTDESQTQWVFNTRLSTGDEHIPSPCLADQNPDALKNLAKALFEFSLDNLPRFMATLGYGAMATQFQAIIKVEGAFPILNNYGDPGGMKSIAAESAASLFGSNWATDGVVSHSSESALYERLKLTGNILTVYDDPMRDSRSGNPDEVLKRLYNAKSRVVRGNVQTPYSPVLVTTNHVCGDDSAATKSRLIRLSFPVVKISNANKRAYSQLRDAQRQASGALPDLIKLGYPKAEIDEIELELLLCLPGAHLRIAKSLAQLTYYTQRVCDLAKVDLDFKQWVKITLCPLETDADANRNSLQDFLEKVEISKGKSILGEWNVATVKTRDGGEQIALVLPEVWSVVDRDFNLPYSQSLIKTLITEKGGEHNKTQKFFPNKDITLAYHRNRLLYSNATPPDKKSKKCSLIPVELLPVTDNPEPVTDNGDLSTHYPAMDTASFDPQVTQVTTISDNDDNDKQNASSDDDSPPCPDSIGTDTKKKGNSGNSGDSGNSKPKKRSGKGNKGFTQLDFFALPGGYHASGLPLTLEEIKNLPTDTSIVLSILSEEVEGKAIFYSINEQNVFRVGMPPDWSRAVHPSDIETGLVKMWINPTPR